jgi:hypothetical protein
MYADSSRRPGAPSVLAVVNGPFRALRASAVIRLKRSHQYDRSAMWARPLRAGTIDPSIP